MHNRSVPPIGRVFQSMVLILIGLAFIRFHKGMAEFCSGEENSAWTKRKFYGGKNFGEIGFIFIGILFIGFGIICLVRR
jgi:hypothetical protein